MPDQNQSAIVEELRRRGLLATGGNIRALPFAESEAIGTGNAATSSPASSGGSVTQNQDGTVNATDLNGNPVVVDPNTLSPQDADGLSDDSISGLLPYVAGGVASYLAYKLFQRSGKKSPAPGNPPVNGGTVVANDPLAPLPDDIIEGEFTPVDEKQLSSPPKQIKGPANRLTSDTADAIAERRSGPPKPTIAMPDEFADFTPEELARARAIAESLVMRRQKGNVRAYGPKGKGTTGNLPTSKGRKTETVDEMMGNVARILRDQKALQALRKAVP